MPYCKNCGNQLADTAKFCSKCGQQIIIQEKKLKPKWSFEKFLIDNPPNDKGVIKCPRCLGKGHVDKKDITRLDMDGLQSVGDCQYCDGIGLVNIKKIDSVPIDLSEESVIEKQNKVDSMIQPTNILDSQTISSKQISNKPTGLTINCSYEQLISLIEKDSLIFIKSLNKNFSPKEDSINLDKSIDGNLYLSWLESTKYGGIKYKLSLKNMTNNTTRINLSRDILKVQVTATIILTIIGLISSWDIGEFIMLYIALWGITPLLLYFINQHQLKLIVSRIEKLY